RRVMAATIAVGARFPAYGTAAGRLLLAGEPQPDCVLLEGDPEPGVSTMAAPVRDRSGRVVAGAILAMHSGRMSPAAARRDLLPRLLAAVARIEADLRITDPVPDAPPGTATRR
ncbi:IclR family transcriptional regulator, partial [Streptomyces sp. NPDC059627]